jgi:hypothetical protein
MDKQDDVPKQADDSPNPFTPAGMPASDRTEPRLPFRWFWPFLAGVASGLVIRLVYSGKAGEPYAAMMASFIYLAPLAVGAVTVYVAELSKRRSWGYYFYAPFLANVLLVLGTLAIMVEGLICAIVIVPLFAVYGSIGGLVMGAICRKTNWPKKAVYSIAALPLILGAFENHLSLPEQIRSVESSIVIAAPPHRVWRELLYTRAIKPEEVDSAWAYRIGVPVPLAGVSDEVSGELVRKITMGKGVHFEQVSTDWQNNHHVRWRYRFQKDSFPPNALDDHVMIGGHYFDLQETLYSLTPVANGTRLDIRVQYRVSTQFNWYANAVAQVLLGNFSEAILKFYRHRSVVGLEGELAMVDEPAVKR